MSETSMASLSASATSVEPLSASAPLAAPQGVALPRWLLYSVSLLGGFQIMALEVAGFRVLQTALGSSVLVTGTLLTLVMLLLSAGYYVGGRLSMRPDASRVLFGLLVLAALYTQLSSVILLDVISAWGSSLRTALGAHPYLRVAVPATVLSLVLYGPPVFCMSMISPCCIRARASEPAREARDPGLTSGFFMSLSTTGSIIGTIVSSYALIPFLGVSAAVAGANLVFLGVSVLAFFRARSAAPRVWLLRALCTWAAFALLLVWGGLGAPAADPNVIYDAESHYGQIRVIQGQDHAGRRVLTYHPSRVYTHSMLYPDDPLRELGALMYLVPGMVEPPRNVLVLGSAAGGILRKIELAFPAAHVTGVDIDPEVHRVATDVFHVDTTRADFVSADARAFLLESRDRYDLIIVDLFSGEFIPTHCVTREFFELVRARLSAGGNLFVNTNMNDVHHDASGSGEPFRPIRHLQSTLRAAGFDTLFENSFFHSFFAFQRPLSIERFRQQMLEQLTDESRLLQLRVGAGLAAYTTVDVPRGRSSYRPYTDRWTPGFLIELKSNERDIYAHLRDATAAGQPEPTARRESVGPVVLAQRLSEWQRSDEPSLLDLTSLLTSLNAVERAPGPDAIDESAKYLRFSYGVLESRVAARSEWAKLASSYAELWRLGENNEYEALLPVLLRLREYVVAA